MLKLQLLMQIFVEELVKSQQLLQILIELFNPEITFYKSESSLQIQELSSIQTEIYFQNRKIYFVTCFR